jgi:glycosyltransferase involved in cell wall biosynthesis
MSLRAAPITVFDLRDSPWVDGPGRTILDCAETLDASRVRMVIGAFDGGDASRTAYEHEARSRGLEVFRIHERRSLDPDVLRQVLELGRKSGADIVHSHDFRSNVLGLICARRLGVPWMATVHGWIANDWKGSARTLLDKQVLRHADHVIAVSGETRSRLGRWADRGRCTVIPNALRVERYQPRRGPGPFRAEHGIAADELLIANIGRLSPEKGQLALLMAASDLLRRHRRLRFVFFGLGPDQPRLERFITEHGLGDRVIFAGYRDDIGVIYNELDLVVQSSLTEGMPNVVLESLLMEVAVIATDVGGTREVLKDGETGMLVPPGDHARLIAAIEHYLMDRAGFTKMARAGREDVRMRFDHALRVRHLTEVYERVAAGHGASH